MSENTSNRTEKTAEQVNSLVKQGQWLQSEESYENLMYKIDELNQNLQEQYSSKRGV